MQHWDVETICLTLMLSTCGAFTSLTITSHLRHCRNFKWYWVFTVTAGLGIGFNTVWCMHFVGMGALSLFGGVESGATDGIRINFEASFTIVSCLAAWAIAATGLHIMAGRDVNKRSTVDREMFVRLTFASILIALGVCVMHYMGMVSQTGPFSTHYAPAVVAASVLIALVASAVGLLLLVVLPNSLLVRVIASVVISVAVNGMHYTGMLAATYRVTDKPVFLVSTVLWDIDSNTVSVLALIFDLALYTVCNYYGDEQKRELEHLRQVEDLRREQTLQRTVTAAVRSVEELGHPMIVIKAPNFLDLGLEEVGRLHEEYRASGNLKVFDTKADVFEAKANGAFLIFFSYECLAYKQAGPNKVQLATMKAAVQELAASSGKQMDDIFIWLDCLSIPQRNRAMMMAAINAIYTFASMPNAMVLICPESTHADTGRPASGETMRERLWCRVEHVAYCCSRGVSTMFLHRGEALEPLPEEWMPSVCCVYESMSTCCRLKHKTSPSCDRETCVLPLLALYYDVYSRKELGRSDERDFYAWNLIKQHRERMFPRTFTYQTENGDEERPLFADMLERVEALVKEDKIRLTVSRDSDFLGVPMSDTTSTFMQSEGSSFFV